MVLGCGGGVCMHVYTVDVIGSIPVGPTLFYPVNTRLLAGVAGFFHGLTGLSLPPYL